ncbi:Transcriptional regulator, AraC family [Marinobacterium lacunae]|uniref:Transcriptional regulator, AraC family n=1 Tax=Marinobacterium lacunae TaxID=1232683 RepID=A0A081FXY1_9GAMM|nr:Transcriptional regulator, AraC family [Marinobacterium lacunae]
MPSGMALAHWHNDRDRIHQEENPHHTLSLYIEDGYESYRRQGNAWHNGGGPDRMCLMPEQSCNTWDIRGPLTFVHFYFNDRHIRELAENTWDRSPAEIRLDEKIFTDDAKVTAIYRQFLLNCDWQAPEEQLQLTSAVNLLLAHLIKGYTQLDWTAPRIRGGLAPYQLKRVIEYIESSLDRPIPLSELAAIADLSEYHFARMFRQSLGIPPHQYLTNRRLERARDLLITTKLPLTDIALRCGFSSSSHFSNCFRKNMGYPPSDVRRRAV